MNRTKRLFILLLTPLALAIWPDWTEAAKDATKEIVPRVARISYIEGPASMQRTTDEEWTDALLNLPLMIGDKVYSGVGGRVEIQLEDDTVVRLGSDSYLHFANLEDALTRIGILKGTVTIHARRVGYTRAPIEVQSKYVFARIDEWANLRLNIDEYGVAEVLVRRGHTDVKRGDDGYFKLSRGDQLRITGPDAASIALETVNQEDDFDQWCDMRDAMQSTSISSRHVTTRMAGYSDLDYYGNWIDVPDYGTVWRPRTVVDNWAPYRDGRWTWRGSFGWTWVSYEPWGWAPYHYGRWVYADRHNWCWVPHAEVVVLNRRSHYYHRRPVWYPSLVSFTYARHGRHFGFSLGSRHYHDPCVGWFPLGPYDHYDYWDHYRHNRHSIGGSGNIVAGDDVKINNGTVNYGTINNGTINNIYQNQAAPNALTVMPQRDFESGNFGKQEVATLDPSKVRNNQIEVGPATSLRFSPKRTVQSKAPRSVAASPNSAAPGKASTTARTAELSRDSSKSKSPRATTANSTVSAKRSTSTKPETTAPRTSPSRTTVGSKRRSTIQTFDRPSIINDVKRSPTSRPARVETSKTRTTQPSRYSPARSTASSVQRQTVPTGRTMSPSRSASSETRDRSSLIQDAFRPATPSRSVSETRSPSSRSVSPSRSTPQTSLQSSAQDSRSRYNYERSVPRNVITIPRTSRNTSRSNVQIMPPSRSSSSSRSSGSRSLQRSPSYSAPRTSEPSSSSYRSTPSRSSGNSSSYRSSGSSRPSSSYRSSSSSRPSTSSRSSSYSPSRSSGSSSASSRSNSSYRSSSSSRSSVTPSRSSSIRRSSSRSSSVSSSRSSSGSRSSGSSPSRSSGTSRSSRSSDSTSSPRR